MKLAQHSTRSARSSLATRIVVLASWLLVARATAQARPDRELPAGFGLHLAVAGGFGQRAISVPTRAGDRLLDSALFPALGVSLDGAGPIGTYGLLGLRFHYQTSLGLQATEQPAAGSGRVTSLRSHHVEAGITPGLRFADSSESVVLRLFAGWGFRGLRAVTDVAVPQYMLHGPVLRPELRLPFARGTAEVRLGPELQWISGMSSELRQLTSAANGFAWGAEIELGVKLTRALRLYIDYRESHVRADSAWGQAFKDTERFATAGLDLCN